MNRTILVGLSLIVSLANAANSLAQAPAAPAGIPGMPAAPAAPAAPTSNIWSMICPTADQKAACKQCFCNSPLGQMFSGAAGPMAAMTGGLMGGPGNCCSRNSLLNDLKKGADDPNGLAARIKADEEDAKARRAAVRYLGTVDCSYWPEATEVLKAALRKDRNECVRFEAALSLRRGCCCNRETVEALTNCVLGENKKDPFPAECSERVRAVAAEALMRCPLLQMEPPHPLEKLVKDDGKARIPEAFARKAVEMSAGDDVIANARGVLASLQKGAKPPEESAHGSVAPPAVAHVVALAPRNNSVSGIVANALASSSSSPAADSGPRQPFFSGLTKQLTGKQEPGTSNRQSVAAGQPPASADAPRDPRAQITISPAYDARRQTQAAPAGVVPDPWRQMPAAPVDTPPDFRRQIPAESRHIPYRGLVPPPSESEVDAAAQIGAPIPVLPATGQPLQTSASAPAAHFEVTFLPARPLDVPPPPTGSADGQAVNPPADGDNRQQP